VPPLNLVRALRSPESTLSIPESDWNGILAQGRKHQLSGQLAARLEHAQLLNSIPETVRRHLELELITARRRTESALWEIATMRRAVSVQFPLILLKGCAYAVSGDKNASGRMFSDIDILVCRESLAVIEVELSSVGWKPSQVNEYDERYYRNWMHEVPPMEHVRRHTIVDLHHAINPPVSPCFVSPEKLLSNLDEVRPGIFVLSASDRVVHCALHLLQEGEPKKLLRDLYDLFVLVEQHFTGKDGEMRLTSRARELGVAHQVCTAVSAAREVFGNFDDASYSGSRLLQRCLVAAACAQTKNLIITSSISEVILLAYSHLIKMPPRLLFPHLVRKALVGWNENQQIRA
jgi:hypothetical protein